MPSCNNYCLYPAMRRNYSLSSQMGLFNFHFKA